MNALATKALMAHSYAITLPGRMKVRARTKIRSVREDGQGTVEYAILVGVLAVIAIIAIVGFKGHLQSLWDAIKDNLAKIAPTKKNDGH